MTDENPSIPIVDLRSDTVTRPTLAMHRAMAEAEVGDDVYGEDPTVNRLQSRAAEIFGREAALYVPSGSMANTIAMRLLTRPGQEVICEQRSHIFNYEMGSICALAGCVPRPVPGTDGILHWDQIRAAIRPKVFYSAQTALVACENTHNVAGGRILPLDITNEICDAAHDAGLRVHLDGARVFNAAVALGIPVADLTRKFDSVTFCVSKGLGAPVGSLLMGSGEFIQQARLQRKILGGGMRQAGVIAAAGLIALENSPARLHIDHENAQVLARGLAQVPGIGIDPARVETNILIVNVSGTGMTSGEIAQRLAARSVRVHAMDPAAIRILTHCDVTREDCERAVAEMADVVESRRVPEKVSG